MFQGAIRRLARINDSDTKLKQTSVTEDELIEEITQPKDFNRRAHLKYNKSLIGDDQTNNDKISETVPFLFYFLFKIPAILSQ